MLLTDLTLLESDGRKTILTMEQAVNIASKNYMDYFKRFKEPAHFRGSDTHDSSTITLVNPMGGGGTRTGVADGGSFGYTELISNLPSWSGLPKRDQCIIATQNYQMADDYGSVACVVFPNTGTIISTEGDFLYMFEEVFATEIPDIRRKLYLREISQFLKILFGHISSYNDFISNKIPKFIDQYNSGELKSYVEETGEEGAFIRYITGGGDTTTSEHILHKLDNLLNPNHPNSKIEICSGASDINISHHSGEVWTSSPCLLIDLQTYGELRSLVI